MSTHISFVNVSMSVSTYVSCEWFEDTCELCEYLCI